MVRFACQSEGSVLHGIPSAGECFINAVGQNLLVLQTSIKNCTFPREMRADSVVCFHFVRGAINCRDMQHSSVTLISNGRDIGRKPAAT